MTFTPDKTHLELVSRLSAYILTAFGSSSNNINLLQFLQNNLFDFPA